ncbi:RluA family pseudouridine synthase [Halobacteriovorax sp.]|uniref:RluA family pseudouridine synthase n=1 Tax=Halobacteriovorax sp. TaxID=2020862 RepID=UPI003565A426
MLDKNFCTLKPYKSLEELLTKELFFSKSLIKKFLSKRKLQYSLKERDEILIPYEILNSGYINPVYSGEEIQVLKEDENFIAVNKPAGIHGHAHNYSETNTVLNFIRSEKNFPVFLQKSAEAESNLLYRLDRETSGVLIFAKNMKSFKSVRGSFAESAKEKTYLAVVSGKFDQEGDHEHYLESFGEKGSKMRTSESGNKKVRIATKLVNYNSEKDISLLEVRLGQGVRHQIRCQLSAIGFPILGDDLYGGQLSERLFLHAYKYKIELDSSSFEAESKEEKLFLSLFDLNSCL